jgi:P-type Ca2+ transporter type 2C
MQKHTGLNKSEVEKARKKYGFNEIEEINKISWRGILFRQIRSNFIIYFLLVAMFLSFFVGKSITGYVILCVILVVIMTGFFQEYKAEKSIEKLKKMVTPVSLVIRGGIEQEIATREIVPGDILVLHTGERIPADCVVLSEKDLLLNESILSGEAEEIKKYACKDLKKYNENNILYSGSFIVNGKAVAKVISIGMKTKFGKIASLISEAEKELPLQRKVNTISKYMVFLGILMAVLTGGAVWLQSSFSTEIIILAIAIAVSAFPEGFPVVLITTLSKGVYDMAKKNVIVNRMSIIETLGETTVICSDKTGTITKGEMMVRKIFSDKKNFEVSGVGYGLKGEFLLNSKKINPLEDNVLKKLLKASVACNDSIIKKKEKEFEVIGSPTESSLLVLASKAGLYKEDIPERIDEIPFSSERKTMSVLLKEDKKYILYSKGAFERVLEKCDYVQRNEGVFRLLKRDKERLIRENAKMTSKGLRTLSLAYKEIDKKKMDSEKGLVFLGIVGIEDAPREGIQEAIMICREAGIKTKMITGDDKETAIAIAKQINLDKGKVLEGYELDKFSDRELYKVVKETVVFARVNPEHKLRIVKALKEHGEIVTMTGDGVNDAPALKEAHIGVAMGKNGTDVSRSAADLTLKDDNFVTLVDAVREGRTIFKNIRKFVTYQLSCNYAELFILFIGVLLVPFLGWPIPLLLALQILFMNLVTDNLPAITLGLNKSSADIMDEKPRKDKEILNKPFFNFLLISGSLMAIFVLVIFYVVFNILGQEATDARTTVLLTLIFLEIAAAFNFRSFRKTTLNRSPLVNPYLALASTISLIATALIIYTPLNKFFGTSPIPLIDWIISFGISLVFLFIFDIFKKFNNKKKWLDLGA